MCCNMIGLGTIINCIAIVIGGVLGLVFGNLMKARLQEILMTATALCVLFIGIGGALKSGKPHDGRAPDYDDWSLNGDILVWDKELDAALEISSMGIRGK